MSQLMHSSLVICDISNYASADIYSYWINAIESNEEEISNILQSCILNKNNSLLAIESRIYDDDSALEIIADALKVPFEALITPIYWISGIYYTGGDHPFTKCNGKDDLENVMAESDFNIFKAVHIAL